jgi:type II secretory pathway component PulF
MVVCGTVVVVVVVFIFVIPSVELLYQYNRELSLIRVASLVISLNKIRRLLG